MHSCTSCGKPLPEGAIMCPFDGTPIRANIRLAANEKIGEYILQEKIGEGAMGEVWRGVHPTISKKVAIKALHSDTLLNQEALARFIQEAKIVNEIQHRNLVDIFSFGELEDKRPYFVMEYLDGKSLAEYLVEKGPLPFAEILEIFEQVCAALSAAHDKNVLHRDIKPSNIFLLFQKDKPPFVKLIDFGIAKLPKGDQGTLTQTNAIFGTPAYMSPEHCDGVRYVDHRADLYSLGVVLYECITGANPFATYPGAPMGEILLRHLSLEPPPVSQSVSGRSIPAALDRFLKKVLAKKKEDRPQSAHEFYQELKSALGKLSYEKQLDGAKPKRAKFISPSSSPRGAWVGLLLVVSIAAFAYSQSNKKSTPEVVTQTIAVPAPKPSTITLEISSSPSNASVSLDGVLLGETPLTKSVSYGELPQELQIEKAGYLTQQTKIIPTNNHQKNFFLEPQVLNPKTIETTASKTNAKTPTPIKPTNTPTNTKIDDDPNSTYNPFDK
jgi:serine/threonine protein kinase